MLRARGLDPSNPLTASVLGYTLYLQRRYEESVEELLKVLDLDPGYHFAHWILSMTYLSMSRLEESMAETQRALAISSEDLQPKRFLAWVLGLAGRKDEAAAIASMRRPEVGYH